MNDEEYYECFRVPKELIDEVLDRIASAGLLNINHNIMQMVKEEVGNNPNKDKVLEYFQLLSVASAKRIGDKLMELAEEASREAAEEYRRQKVVGQTGIG